MVCGISKGLFRVVYLRVCGMWCILGSVMCGVSKGMWCILGSVMCGVSKGLWCI